jgi:alpha-glucuronidase
MTTLNFNTPTANLSRCWLPINRRENWLQHYLQYVHLPEMDHPVKVTLCSEIKALNDNVFFSNETNNLSLEFTLSEDVSQDAEQYTINIMENKIFIAASGWQGLLYAWFHLLRHREIPSHYPLIITEKPAFAVRMINHWDNMDGTIERGYAGRSFFFRNNRIDYDPQRLHNYARLLASIGINAIAINNVNVHHHETALINDELLPQVSGLAAIFRQYAIRFFLSINLLRLLKKVTLIRQIRSIPPLLPGGKTARIKFTSTSPILVDTLLKQTRNTDPAPSPISAPTPTALTCLPAR